MLRITFDWHDNEKRLLRYLYARSLEIMERMRPTRIVSKIYRLARIEWIRGAAAAAAMMMAETS